MKALTIYQPYAQLVALGVKTIETRGWATKYRGRLIIHASAARPIIRGRIGSYSVRSFGSYEGGGWVLEGPGLPKYRQSPQLAGQMLRRGCVVASCELGDVVPILHGTYDLALEPPRRSVVGGPEPHNLSLWRNDGDPEGEDIDDQFPYGDFRPGGYAWLLEDIKPVEERCPACWGEGELPEPNPHPSLSPTGQFLECPYCDGKGKCDPIPAKGRQRLWEWESGE